MTRKDALALIRAMREIDARASVVTLDRVANGTVTYSVKAVGRDVRATAKRAQQVFDSLVSKYNSVKS
jgi:hypothetical protein